MAGIGADPRIHDKQRATRQRRLGDGDEVEMETAVFFGDVEGFEGGDDPGGGVEFGGGVSSENGEDAASGGDACPNTCRGILDDDAVGAGESEELGSALVGLGVGLAVLDHLGGDEALGDGSLAKPRRPWTRR